jgi:hypothetical protein
MDNKLIITRCIFDLDVPTCRIDHGHCDQGCICNFPVCVFWKPIIEEVES